MRGHSQVTCELFMLQSVKSSLGLIILLNVYEEAELSLNSHQFRVSGLNKFLKIYLIEFFMFIFASYERVN